MSVAVIVIFSSLFSCSIVCSSDVSWPEGFESIYDLKKIFEEREVNKDRERSGSESSVSICPESDGECVVDNGMIESAFLAVAVSAVIQDMQTTTFKIKQPESLEDWYGGVFARWRGFLKSCSMCGSPDRVTSVYFRGRQGSDEYGASPALFKDGDELFFCLKP